MWPRLAWGWGGSLEKVGQWEGLEEAQGGQLGMRVCEDDPGVRHGAPCCTDARREGDLC